MGVAAADCVTLADFLGVRVSDRGPQALAMGFAGFVAVLPTFYPAHWILMATISSAAVSLYLLQQRLCKISEQKRVERKVFWFRIRGLILFECVRAASIIPY